MLAVFIAILCVLMVACFIIGKKNILNPILYAYMGYLLMTIMSIFSCNMLGYKISDTTYLLYILLSVSMFVGYLIAELIYSKLLNNKNKKTKKDEKLTKITGISLIKLLIFLLVQLFIFIIFIIDFQNCVGQQLTLSNFSDLINQFRMLSTFGDEFGNVVSLPFITNQLIKLTTVISYVSIYYLISNIKTLNWKSVVLHVLNALPTIVINLFMGARFQFFVLIFYVLFLIIFKHASKKNLKTILISMGAIGCIGLFVLLGSRYVVGRGEGFSPIKYISLYLGNSLLNFDYALNKGIVPNGIGAYTFYGVFSFLSKFGIVKNISFFKEFVYIGTEGTGNTYGGICDYMLDFGIGGIIILGFLFGFIITFLFKLLSKKENMFNAIYTICFAKFFYSIFFDNYTGLFFQNFISLNFVVELVLTIGIMLFVRTNLNRKKHAKDGVNLNGE